MPHSPTRAPAAPAEVLYPPRSVAIMTNINATALFNACVAGDAAAVSRLLPAGGTPRNLSGQRFQFPDAAKTTPLMLAAFGGHTDMVRMILERAPNTTVDHGSAVGVTAHIIAAMYHHADTLRVLAEGGANVNLATHRGDTALFLAVAPMPPSNHPRDPDPDGARQAATVRALLQLDAGKLPSRLLTHPRATLLRHKFPSERQCATTGQLVHLLKPFHTMFPLAAPDPVGAEGMTPLCIACNYGPANVVVALLDGAADIDFATLASNNSDCPGFTPLMYAVSGNKAGVAKLLLKRGANVTMRTTHAVDGHPAGSTALDMARSFADSEADFAQTFTVLRKRCCSTCGMTSPGLAVKTAGEQKNLKRCGECPERGTRARYCNEECQRADWVSRHRGECAEARRARQAAGTEV